jgi:hypothetical protein
MSLREIRGHNRYEIMTMLAALNRFQILQDGQGITEEMRKGPQGIAYTNLHNAYVDEVEKYRQQFGAKNAHDSSDK